MMTKRNLPSLITTSFTIAAMDLSLRVFGFSRSIAMVRKLTRATKQSDDLDYAEAVVRRVAVCSSFHVGRAECLEQSLAAFLLLRRRGVAVDLRIGVQPFPFAAHAWIELNRRPIVEIPEVITRFTPIEVAV